MPLFRGINPVSGEIWGEVIAIDDEMAFNMIMGMMSEGQKTAYRELGIIITEPEEMPPLNGESRGGEEQPIELSS